jgi:hypothetical protein
MTQPKFPVGQYTMAIVKGLIFRICAGCIQSKQLEALNRSKAYARLLKWDTVIEQKTNELARFLTRKTSVLDFVEPAPKLERYDDREVRAKILALTTSDANRLGIGKSTLYHLRKNAQSYRSFKTYKPVLEKIIR